METKESKSEINKSLLGLIVVAIALGGYFYFRNNDVDADFKIPLPYAFSIANNTSFACESLMSANILGSEVKNEIEGDVAKGTDKIAMTIKSPGVLSFITGATVGIGVTEGDNFAIIENNDEKLMAVWFNENAISTVVLNKKNGLGVWLKGNPAFPFHDAPHGQVIYMICR